MVSPALQPLQEVIVAQWLFCQKPVKNQQIHHKMAQGSFASRIFHKYCKNSQEHREPDSEVPHISEFTTMWEKLSKCSVLPLHIKYVGHPQQLQTEVWLHPRLRDGEGICFCCIGGACLKCDRIYTYCFYIICSKTLSSFPVLSLVF